MQKYVCVVDRAFDVLRTDFAATPDRMELGREPVAGERWTDILVDIACAVRRAFVMAPVPWT